MKTDFLQKHCASVTTLKSGDSSLAVAAVQLALGRLGYLKSLVDGSFGPATTAAVRAFQSAAGLTATGVVDTATLALIDDQHSAKDFRVAAAKTPDPIAYLSDFDALGIPRLLDAGIKPRWDDATTQKAFGDFCAAYWPVMKDNCIEADCKTIALFLMHQFQKKAKLDTGNELASPGYGGNSLPKLNWTTFTATDSKGYFSKVNGREVRREYKTAKIIERVMPKHSMIFGVNLAVDVSCARVATFAHRISGKTRHNGGDHHVPEININDLEPGRLIFMNHDGDGDFDHAITVISVRRAQGRVTKVVLAVGSYDDVRDSDPNTKVNDVSVVNNYAEEVVIDFDPSGRVVDPNALPTWASEPLYLRPPEYTAKNTIMDKNSGAKLVIARWGDAK